MSIEVWLALYFFGALLTAVGGVTWVWYSIYEGEQAPREYPEMLLFFILVVSLLWPIALPLSALLLWWDRFLESAQKAREKVGSP